MCFVVGRPSHPEILNKTVFVSSQFYFKTIPTFYAVVRPREKDKGIQLVVCYFTHGDEHVDMCYVVGSHSYPEVSRNFHIIAILVCFLFQFCSYFKGIIMKTIRLLSS